MTDEEIEFALKRYANSWCADVRNMNWGAVLDRINRLKDEIAGLTGKCEALEKDNENLMRTLEECKKNIREAERERDMAIEVANAEVKITDNIRKETAKEILHDLWVRVCQYAMVAKIECTDKELHFLPTETIKSFVEGLKSHYGVEVE